MPQVQLVLEAPGDLYRGRLPRGVFGDAAADSRVHDPSRRVQGVGLDVSVWHGVQGLRVGGERCVRKEKRPPRGNVSDGTVTGHSPI